MKDVDYKLKPSSILSNQKDNNVSNKELNERVHNDLSLNCIIELQELIQSLYKINISIEEAKEYGQNLINIFKVIIE